MRQVHVTHLGGLFLSLIWFQGWTCSFTVSVAEGARRKGPPGHRLGSQAAFVDQMPKNVLGMFHLKGFF